MADSVKYYDIPSISVRSRPVIFCRPCRRKVYLMQVAIKYSPNNSFYAYEPSLTCSVHARTLPTLNRRKDIMVKTVEKMVIESYDCDACKELRINSKPVDFKDLAMSMALSELAREELERRNAVQRAEQQCAGGEGSDRREDGEERGDDDEEKRGKDEERRGEDEERRGEDEERGEEDEERRDENIERREDGEERRNEDEDRREDGEERGDDDEERRGEDIERREDDIERRVVDYQK